VEVEDTCAVTEPQLQIIHITNSKYYEYLYTLQTPQAIQQLPTGSPVLVTTKHYHNTSIILKLTEKYKL